MVAVGEHLGHLCLGSATMPRVACDVASAGSGYGAMQFAGQKVTGPLADHESALAVLREAFHVGITQGWLVDRLEWGARRRDQRAAMPNAGSYFLLKPAYEDGRGHPAQGTMWV